LLQVQPVIHAAAHQRRFELLDDGASHTIDIGPAFIAAPQQQLPVGGAGHGVPSARRHP